MLRLSRMQLDLMTGTLQKRFIRQLISDHDHAGFPACPQPGPDVLYPEWVREANSLGFITDYEVAVYVTACRISGTSVLKGPPIWRECVLSRSRPAAHRAQLLEALVRPTHQGTQ